MISLTIGPFEIGSARKHIVAKAPIYGLSYIPACQRHLLCLYAWGLDSPFLSA